MPCIGTRGTYFGKLLEMVVKGAKVDGCKELKLMDASLVSKQD
jgi:hypothetical protein